jgi:uncharacterized membrane protein
MSELVASLHPPLVSFPFVLTWVVLFLDIFAFVKRDQTYEKMSLYLLNFTTVVTFIAYQSGHQASQFASQTFSVSDQDIGVHFFWAKIFLFVILGALLFKWVAVSARFNQRVWQALSLLTISLAAALVLYVGQLGGDLVFQHGAGVRVVQEK